MRDEFANHRGPMCLCVYVCVCVCSCGPLVLFKPHSIWQGKEVGIQPNRNPFKLIGRGVELPFSNCIKGTPKGSTLFWGSPIYPFACFKTHTNPFLAH